MFATRWVLLICLLLSAGQAGAQSRVEFVPVTDAMLQQPDPEDWLMWRRTPRHLGVQPARPDSTATMWVGCAWSGLGRWLQVIVSKGGRSSMTG